MSKQSSIVSGVSGIALSFGLLAASPAAYAQDTQDTEPQQQAEDEEFDDDDVIVVSGFRSSVANAVQEKRNLDFIAEVVSADDIAGLPDVSIAESLARLPGVTSQRTGGQASAINIRGLSQDLVSASLNGREQVATSGNRIIEFNQYPSELIRQAAVYKTPMASIIEGGVAGRVELETARPLDNKEDFTATFNIRALYNDRADQSPDVGEFGYRFSASIQGKLANDTLGYALGYAKLYQPNVATRFVQFDFPIPGNNGSPGDSDLDGNGTPDRRSFGYEGVQFGGREDRDGLIGVLQWEPTPEFRVMVDGYYSRLQSDVKRRGFRVFSTQSGDTIITDPTIVNNAVTGGTFTNQRGVNDFNFALGTTLVNQDEGRDDELYTFGGNIAWDVSDSFTAALDVSYSRGESFFTNAGINSAPFTRNADGDLVRQDSVPGLISTTFQTNRLDLPTISNISGNFTDTSEFLVDGQFLVPQRDVDDLFAVALDFDVDLNSSFFSSFEFGTRYATRDTQRTVTSLNLPNGFPGVPFQVPDELVTIAGFEGGFAANGFPDFAVFDIDGVYNLALGNDLGVNQPTDQSQPFTLEQSFGVAEDVWAGYAQLNFDGEAGTIGVRGNIGLRLVNTDQSSNFLSGGDVASDGANYWDVLPSANLILDLSPTDVLRISYTRQLSRPPLIDLGGAINATFGLDGVPAGGGGNPQLRPFRANQFDISYEHYFGNDGVFAAALFYKHLESFIIGGVVPDFNFVDAGVFIAPPAGDVTAPFQETGPLSAPVNGDGGYVWGLELNFTYSFDDLLPAPLDGFGVIMNYSFSQSELDFPDDRSGLDISLPLPGLSEHVFNPTLYYEKSGFGGRVGMRHRSSFVAPQIGISQFVVTNAPETVFDAQLSYEFSETSTLSGLKLLAQANNFTDEPTRSFFGTRDQTGTLQFFGRTFFLGATYSF
ncbi:TonB-dependent receptor [Alterisphingorhabdus coralli]|uniref:TonB-dependent receptor n=1 Tax=Alterisphingorhabdus coralli TaxID=3071408 RepID=A0AA97FAI6_9SPHN|nr:TonB-dependent receptor [Parasphingorhabdus sp. SCSIO 66989]WOE75520.1 TonB-dependent receptor [Parasphingorhabdus sp. SCSIO 66989]